MPAVYAEALGDSQLSLCSRRTHACSFSDRSRVEPHKHCYAHSFLCNRVQVRACWRRRLGVRLIFVCTI